MEPQVSGSYFHHHENSVPKKVRRFVARHMEKWAEASLGDLPAVIRRAWVSFDRVGRGHTVSCSVSLETPLGVVRSDETAPNLHQAYDACLRRLAHQLESSKLANGSKRLLSPQAA